MSYGIIHLLCDRDDFPTLYSFFEFPDKFSSKPCFKNVFAPKLVLDRHWNGSRLSDLVRKFIYPALQLPYPELCFYDQFAFRPTGSTTAAVIALLHTVRTMLSTDQYVHVFSFDFTKAFDTVRHETLMLSLIHI